MSELDRIKRKLQNALKLSGFNIRKEFCSVIVNKFMEADINLNNNNTFDTCIKDLSSSLESQDISEQSIEQEHISRALEVCLHSGYDKNESIFNVIGAFDFPKLQYDADRKQYFAAARKSQLLSKADTKADLFLDRYNTILRRTRRNFRSKVVDKSTVQLKLQTVDYLLTLNHAELVDLLILGSLLQVSEGKFYLEDPTGIVQLDLNHAVFHGGFFIENGFVLVNGKYEDKILNVATVVVPPGEEYKDSRPEFGALNYFGGPSTKVLKDSRKLLQHLQENKNEMMLFFSDVWLDHPNVFEKLEVLFSGLNMNPPIAFVFIGNFMSQIHPNERLENLRKLFKQFGELIGNYANLVERSEFVFVPGMEDPATPHIVPRLALPKYVTEEMRKVFSRAHFTTNPCRIQYCTKEITIFRADILSKFLQGTLHKPAKSELSQSMARTIISQGHLAPFSLNSLPVHWDFDYTLRLFPTPDLIVIGDKTEPFTSEYKNCNVINPGSFCESGFQFKAYIPGRNTIEDCVL